MAKVYPKTSSSSSSCYITSTREVFTVWMKSLVFNGNGCTVFDSNGDVIYRIDNYDHRSKNEVYLMDLRGKIVVTLRKKKHNVTRFWEGYRGNDLELEEKKAWFLVRNPYRIRKRASPCKVFILGDQDNHQQNCYKIEKSTWKTATAFKIINKAGGLVAEVKQKESTSGVALGKDVMTLVVEPNVDHSLIMSLLVVYSLIHHKM